MVCDCLNRVVFKWSIRLFLSIYYMERFWIQWKMKKLIYIYFLMEMSTETIANIQNDFFYSIIQPSFDPIRREHYMPGISFFLPSLSNSYLMLEEKKKKLDLSRYFYIIYHVFEKVLCLINIFQCFGGILKKSYLAFIKRYIHMNKIKKKSSRLNWISKMFTHRMNAKNVILITVFHFLVKAINFFHNWTNSDHMCVCVLCKIIRCCLLKKLLRVQDKIWYANSWNIHIVRLQFHYT